MKRREIFRGGVVMRRLCGFLALIFAIFLLSGCLIRTYTIQKPRTDTQIQGNRGYIFGSPPEDSLTEIKSKTRTVTVLEIEMGGLRDESELSPPKGSITEQSEIVEPPTEETEEILVEEDYSTEEEIEYQEYRIKKGDTLQKISYKFYGTHKKWPKIFNANRDVLKNPDEIHPGKVIKIPLE